MRATLFTKTVWIGLILVIAITDLASAQSTNDLVPQNASMACVAYRGRQAIRLIAAQGASNGSSYALLKDPSFQDGVIEVDVAGQPVAGATPGARGFIGIAFRLKGQAYEYIYLRPTNGRAEDQVRRNHSTQYGSHPDFDFARLRRDAPEKYESYVDLQPGQWTRLKLEVEGRQARLYLHGAEQPCLIVDDLKMEPDKGGVALWVGPETEGYFCNLKIMPKGGASPFPPSAPTRIYFDQAHGEFPPPPPMLTIGKKLGYTLEAAKGDITPQSLNGSRLVYLRAPNGAFNDLEKKTIVDFVQTGGSLLLVLDEEKRQSLAKTGVNDLITPFGIKLSMDTPRIVNTGAIAKVGEINQADREIPYDGGREVFGGTPFAYQLDQEGFPAQPSAAFKKLENGARIVVMGEGMASLFLGSENGVRLKGDPPMDQNIIWWGKDSAIFMEEVLRWLLAR
jgi:hypothetical protein